MPSRVVIDPPIGLESVDVSGFAPLGTREFRRMMRGLKFTDEIEVRGAELRAEELYRAFRSITSR